VKKVLKDIGTTLVLPKNRCWNSDVVTIIKNIALKTLDCQFKINIGTIYVQYDMLP
jgi:hypothetical protein